MLEGDGNDQTTIGRMRLVQNGVLARRRAREPRRLPNCLEHHLTVEPGHEPHPAAEGSTTRADATQRRASSG
jgi:hypothetical protein